MKVIELLMQGNKVWNKDKEGYFELDQRRNRLYFTDINTKRRKTYPQIVLQLALREGEIYKEEDTMRCEQCGEKIKYQVTYLDLPCYASTKTLRFCDSDCLNEWIEEHSSIDELEDDFNNDLY